MSKKISIALDGPAGAGKSTIARLLAKETGFKYVDTGAIYRTVGYYMNLMGIGPKDVDGITRLIDEVNLKIIYTPDGEQHMILNGKDVSGELRTPEMGQIASLISAQKVVRDFLLDMQRQVARENNVIMDGRDIGTVVLPNADLKIFLTASAEVRAARRMKDFEEKGIDEPYSQVLSEIRQRDDQDMHRAIAPLKQAKDAVLLDTSDLDIPGVVDRIMGLMGQRGLL